MNNNEIEHIAAPYLEQIEYALIDNEKPHGLDEAMRLMVEFARAVEKEVRQEYEPKFKVGDRVRSIYDKRKDAIITKIEQTRFYALKYEDDKYEPTPDYQDYEIEKIEEKL